MFKLLKPLALVDPFDSESTCVKLLPPLPMPWELSKNNALPPFRTSSTIASSLSVVATMFCVGTCTDAFAVGSSELSFVFLFLEGDGRRGTICFCVFPVMGECTIR